jgi:hypothetical protein
MDATLPKAGALLEFQGFVGDCGETAELVILHIYKDVSLDAAHLNALVREEIAAHEAGAQGQETLAAIGRNLTLQKLAFEQYGYAEPFNTDWRQMLRDHAGHNGIVLQFARAGMLPGDESGVKYHFVTVVGQKGGAYLVADGDNVAARKSLLVTYTEAQLASAAPCGLILITTPLALPAPVPAPAPSPAPSQHMLSIAQASAYFIQIDASHWKCKMNGHMLRAGILNAYCTWPAQGSEFGLTALGLPLGDEYQVKPGIAAQRFERGLVVYDPSRIYDNPPGSSGSCYLGHV